jgi:hypothetical protein
MADNTAENQVDIPGQVIIRDREIIRKIESERQDRDDRSCTRTAEKILTEFFAQKPKTAAAGA